MFDGSQYPIEENIEKTTELVKLCHGKGLSIEAEVGSIGGEEDGVVGMVNGMIKEMDISVPVALHLDHGSYEGCLKCIDAGFSSVMFDGSHYPIDENVEKTK